MPRQPVSLPPLVFPLPQETDRPLRWRLHQGLRGAILNGQFPPGTRLPSSRALADSFGVSRATVVEAFDQLAAEGFIERRAGSGTYVSHLLADLHVQRPRAGSRGDHRHRQPARRARPDTGPAGTPTRPIPFTPCEPDPAQFPHQVWAKLLARNARSPGETPPGAGIPRLRDALAAHLSLSRGVTTEPAQVIVVAGAQQALHLAAHVLLDPGDRVWFEDPGYPAARKVFSLAGAQVVPVPVDEDGLDVAAGRRLAPDARAAYVSPSHQFPTGALMGLGRRLQLLDWAAHQDAWVLEDDYDSEFCHDRPLPALQGLDEHQSVIYLGTLNKITYPGFRLGYLVAPAGIVDAFEHTAATMSLAPPSVVQSALADFITEGHLARHIHRMRGIYQQRQEIIIDEIRRHLAGTVTVQPGSTGMHILASIRGLSAADLARRGRAHGLDLRPLSGYTLDATAENALVLGFTHLDPAAIKMAVRELARLAANAVPPR